MDTQVNVHLSFHLSEPRTYFRIPHDVERRNVNFDDFRYRGDGTYGKPRVVLVNGEPSPKPYPEVYRLFVNGDTYHTILDCYWQRILREMNPNLSIDKVSTLLGNKLALTNGTGFPGKRNCLTGADADKPFPRLDQPRIFGGASLAGEPQNGRVFLESLLEHETVYTAEQILSMPWLWFYWTSVNPQGEVNYITRLGTDGQYHRIKFPFVTAEQVYLPATHLHKVTGIADPLTIF